MKRPGILTYLLGNDLVFLTLGCATLWALYGLFTGDGMGIGLIALLIAGYVSFVHHERLRAYRQWKREWESLHGAAPRPLSWGWLRYAAAIGLWLIGAASSPELARDPSTAWAAWLFWMGSTGGAAHVFWRFIQRVRARLQPRDVAVAVCPSVPLRSPSVAHTYPALPDYCGRLLRGAD